MMEKWGAAPNMAIGGAAVLLDLGCTPPQAAALAVFLNENVFAANAFEAAPAAEPAHAKIARLVRPLRRAGASHEPAGRRQ